MQQYILCNNISKRPKNEERSVLSSTNNKQPQTTLTTDYVTVLPTTGDRLS
jgi:hypothetical protein